MQEQCWSSILAALLKPLKLCLWAGYNIIWRDLFVEGSPFMCGCQPKKCSLFPLHWQFLQAIDPFFFINPFYPLLSFAFPFTGTLATDTITLLFIDHNIYVKTEHSRPLKDFIFIWILAPLIWEWGVKALGLSTGKRGRVKALGRRLPPRLASNRIQLLGRERTVA